MLHVSYIKRWHLISTCKLGLATGGTMTDLYEQLVKLLNKNQLNVDNVSIV